VADEPTRQQLIAAENVNPPTGPPTATELAEEETEIAAFVAQTERTAKATGAVAPSWHLGWGALRTVANQTLPQRVAQLGSHIDNAWRNLARG
jgi:hypothetical protein